MKTIHTRTRIGPNGILDLSLPSGMADTEVDVVIVLNPTSPAPPTNGHAAQPADRSREEWKKFVQETAGSIPDLERPPQGEFEQREPWP